MKNYFEILGVSENATDDEIKKAYRSLSKKYHPDVNPEGGDKFKEIAEAYDVLSDPQKKGNYINQKNNPFTGTDFEDFFKNMFGGNRPQQQRRAKGPDKVIKMNLTVLESYKGVDKEFSYQRNVACNDCNGSGGEQRGCDVCKGSGVLIQVIGSGFFQQHVRSTCPGCQGKGYILTKYCNTCSGVGVKSMFETLRVTLPKGADDGQFFKMDSKGDFSQMGYGDLVLQIFVEPSDNFTRMNNDLIYDMVFDYGELLTDTFTIPHPDGEIKISAPNLFDTTKPLRVKGKGFPGGDLYVKLNVKFDKTKISQKQT
jgi:molecular chaperone DnaJ